MRILLLLLGAVVLALGAAERRNVLLLVSADLNAGLGCDGAIVHSPGIDAFATRAPITALENTSPEQREEKALT